MSCWRAFFESSDQNNEYLLTSYTSTKKELFYTVVMGFADIL